MLQVMLSSLTLVLFLMTFVFFIAQILEDNSIVDIVWGLGFVFIAVFTLSTYGNLQYRQVLITTLTLLWGLRLSTHILIRKKGKGEDFRYKKMREKWEKYFHARSYLNIFVFQGLLMLVIALPIMIVNNTSQDPQTWLDGIGLLVWSFGFVFEVISDWQLRKFKKNPKNKGKIMKEGLWSWSRHPNYFGEIVMWWGIYIVALSSPGGFYTLISPLVITNLIVFYSGIPLLEEKYKNNKKYQKYAKKTPMLVPKIKFKD